MKTACTALLLIFASFSSLANGSNAKKAQSHSLGIKLGHSELSAGKYTAADGEGILQGLYYGYQLDSNWSLVLSAESADNMDCALVCGGGIIEPQASYESYAFSVKGQLPLSHKFSLFGKLGANYYETELANSEQGIRQNTGVGALYAVGADYQFSDNFVIGLESSWLEMDELKSTNFGISFQYRL
mgnify:CR=1 FL=1